MTGRLTHVSLFSGIGGNSIAAQMAGFEEVLFCEIDPWCQSVLKHHWPDVPIVEEATGKPLHRSAKARKAE